MLGKNDTALRVLNYITGMKQHVVTSWHVSHFKCFAEFRTFLFVADVLLNGDRRHVPGVFSICGFQGNAKDMLIYAKNAEGAEAFIFFKADDFDNGQ